VTDAQKWASRSDAVCCRCTRSLFLRLSSIPARSDNPLPTDTRIRADSAHDARPQCNVSEIPNFALERPIEREAGRGEERLRRAPRSRLSLRSRLSPQRGRSQAGRLALLSQKPHTEQFRGESDEMHVPHQNAISTVLIIKIDHFSPLIQQVGSRARGLLTGREHVVNGREPSWASLLLRDDRFFRSDGWASGAKHP